jgi:hypothetical protein
MSTENELSVNKAPKLTGKEVDYFQWEIGFQAYAGVRNVLASIDPDKADPQLPDASEDVPANGFTNEQKKAMERNTVAMYNLTLALTSQSSMGFILKARTKEYPGGSTRKVMALIKTWYAPKDRVSRLEMRRQLAAVNMNETANPSIMIEEFHRLSNIFIDLRNGLEISPYDFMAQVFSVAPPVY